MITMHLDWTQRIKDDGLKVTIITYGSRKAEGSPLRELSDEALAAIQQDINTMGELFVNTVSRNRGISAKVIKVPRPPVLWLLMALKLDWLMRCVLLTLRSKTYLKKQEPEMAKKNTFSFAHLIGLGPSASEEEEDKKAKKAKARRAEEDEREDDADDDERDDDAEEDERDDDAEDDGDDPDASEDDDSEDDGDDDRKESKAVKNARAAERKRCARIFGSKHAAANPSLAASLAFNTGMSSAAAINVLASSAPAAAASQPSRKRSLDQRMQESHQVRLNPDGGQKETGKSALVSKMTGLYNSTRGEK